MPGRLLALGDIHGYPAPLDALVEAAQIGPDDTLVTLGDYVDRGPNSRRVIDRLIALESRCRLVALRGNHDLMFTEALNILDEDSTRFAEFWNEPLLRIWAQCGGFDTIESYGSLEEVPPEHRAFLDRLVNWHETDNLLFMHANYDPLLPMASQPSDLLYWTSLHHSVPDRHHSGKTAIVGHSSQKDGEVLDLGHVICIDTYCYGGGWLTLMDLHSGQLWQADRRGQLRTVPAT
ncbi:metallophosphoesterase family protein [Tautonia rosea]|uniref:metallophosphoesterase family protein n=1 Tax=Tautonia rosea TaxID=2728037 RepID=UPI001474AB48|nr:metallophosphoesterase family protein [Tautonia rosea]